MILKMTSAKWPTFCHGHNDLAKNYETPLFLRHYNDVIMGAMSSQITSLTIVYSRLFRCRWMKTSKLRVTGLCAGNSPVTSEFPAQRASYAENVSFRWRHHVGTEIGVMITFPSLIVFAGHDDVITRERFPLYRCLEEWEFHKKSQ